MDIAQENVLALNLGHTGAWPRTNQSIIFFFKLYWYLFYLPCASLEFDFSGSCLVTGNRVTSLLRMCSVCRYTVSQPEVQAYFNVRDFSFFPIPLIAFV